jgi:hypothetical protein
MKTEPRYAIKQKDGHLFLRSEIDPGGMSVTWMDIIYADIFSERKTAETFVERCKERYSKDEFEIIEI